MHLYEAGVPLPYIRDILGHVDLTTTEIYARASTEAKLGRAQGPRALRHYLQAGGMGQRLEEVRLHPVERLERICRHGPSDIIY